MAKRSIYIPKDVEKLLKKLEQRNIKLKDVVCDAIRHTEDSLNDRSFRDLRTPKDAYDLGYYRGAHEGRRNLTKKIEKMASKIAKAITTALNT
jgi:hypothetical protein